MALKPLNSVDGFSVGANSIINVIDANGNVTANTLTVNSTSNLGNVGNVVITGGSANYYLQTDGTGNLTWAPGGGGGNGNPGGINTEVQFNDSGTFGASANFTFNKANNYVYLNGNANITGSANILGNLSTGNANLGNAVSVNFVSVTNNATVNGTFLSNNITLSGGNVDFTDSSNVELGSVANVHILGGSNGYVLVTDGTGNLSWSGTPSNVTEIQHGYSNVTIPTLNGNIYINANSGVDYNWILDTTGNTTFPSSGTANLGATSTVNVSKANYSYVGTYANGSEYVNATAVFSNFNIIQSYPDNIGLVAEAKANAANANITGIGVLGYGQTSGGTKGTGVQGEGHVTNATDTGAAVGIRAYATDSHSAGYNIGVLANAQNSGLNNFALYIQNGGIGSIENPTFWDIYDNSNVALTLNSSMTPNIFVVNSTDGNTGISVTGYLDVTGNATVDGIFTNNYYYANGQPVDFLKAAGSNSQIQYNNNGDLGANINFTYDAANNALDVNGGNITTGNITVTNNASSNNLTAYKSLQAANANITSGNLTVSTGNIYANSGSVNAGQGFNTSANVQSGNVKANLNIYAGNAAFIGANAANQESNFPNSILLATANAGNYAEASLVNQNPNASADWVAYVDNGNAEAGYADMGMTGSTYDVPNTGLTQPGDGYFVVSGVPGFGGNLVIATAGTGSNNDIVFGNGYDTGNEVMRFNNTLQTFQIKPATVSTSNTTGALTVAGGAGIGGNLHVAGNVYANSIVGNISGNIVIPGSNTDVVFNDNGNANSTGGFTFNKTTNAVSIAGNLTSANANLGNLLTANYGNFAQNVTVTGNIAGNNANITNTIVANGNITSNTNVIANNNMLVGNALFIGSNTSQEASFPNSVLIGSANADQYAAASLVNQNANASVDWVGYGDNGNATAGWVDMGFTGSTYNDANFTITAPNDGYLFVSGVPGLGGNLVIATMGTGTTNDIIFATSPLANGEVMRFSNASQQFRIEPTTVSTSSTTGALKVAGGVGVGGNLNAGGLINATGNVSGGNLSTAGNLSANIANLTKANITGNANVGNLGFGSGVITGTGNVTAGNVIGTIAAGSNTITTTGNANVGNLGFGSGVITGTGNITGGNIIGTIAAGSNAITTTGNITGGNIIGTIAAGSNAITTTGNITGGNIIGTIAAGSNAITTTGNITGGNIIGTIAAGSNTITTTGNITGGNLIGTIAAGSNTITTTGNANVGNLGFGSGVITGTGNITGGNITGNHYGNGSALSSITGGNVTGQVGNALIAGTVYTNAQPNITSVGTLANLTVGNSTANTVFGNGTISATGNANVGNLGFGSGVITGTGNITGGNIIGTIAAGSNTITTTGNANVGNLGFDSGVITGTGNITGGNIIGIIAAGSNTITTTGNITGGNIIGTIAAGSNAITTTGNITAGNIYANTGNANIGNLTVNGTLTAANLAVNTLADGNSNITVINNGNINMSVTGTANVMTITSTGANITGTANVSGNANVGNLGTATLIATTGNITTINSGLLQNGNSNISITGNANINHYVAGNTTSQLTIYNGGTNINGNANIGGTANITGNISAANANFSGLVYGLNFVSQTVTITTTSGGSTSLTATSAPYTTVLGTYDYTINLPLESTIQLGQTYTINNNSTGNVTVKTNSGTTLFTVMSGAISQFIYDSVAGTNNWDVHSFLSSTTISSGNLLQLGNGTTEVDLVAYGNITATSGYVFAGNANGLSHIVGGNVVGNVTSAVTANFANYAGNVTVNAQPNITSVGTLTSLAVTGNTTSANFVGTLANGNSNINITGNGNINMYVVGNTTPQLTLSNGQANISGNLYVSGTTAQLGNVNANNANFTGAVNGQTFIPATLSITATSGGSSSLTVNSPGYVLVYGVAPYTVVLPNNTTMQIGQGYTFNNNSNGVVTIQTYTGSQSWTIQAGGATVLSYTGGSQEWDNHPWFSTQVQEGNAYLQLGNATNTSNLYVYGNIVANASTGIFTGNGSGLTALTGANVTGQVSNSATVANGTSNVVIPSSGGNINHYAGGNLSFVVTPTGANITGTANITGNANVGNVGAGNVVVTQLLTAGNANITGNLNATGNANITGNFFAGGITLNGNGDINLSGTSSNINGANIINASYANITANITAGNINGGNLVQANYITGNGQGITGLLLSSSLSDVVITNPSLSQVLGYNGVNWVNQNQSSTVSAGASVNFWFTSPQILAGPTTNNYANIQTLNGTPNTTAVSYVSGSIPQNTSEVFGVFETGSLSRTQLDAGTWSYSIWANANSTGGGAPSMAVSQYIVTPYSGTITITGTGTSRTAKATGSTPFATSTASSNVSLASYLQTPNALMQITAIANSTSATVTTLSTYVNESAVTIKVLDETFFVGSATLTTTLAAYDFNTTQGATALANTTVGLATVIAATTAVGGGTKNVSVTLNGTSTSSTVQTPLVTLHDNLAGLQGGSSLQYYHLTATEYTGSGSGTFIRQVSPSLTTPNIGNATAIGLAITNSGTGNISADNANLGNLVIANYFQGSGANLSSITGANVTGIVANANYSAYAGNVANGTSNVSIPTAGGEVDVYSAGNLTLAVKGTGANITGTINATGNANFGNVGANIAVLTGNLTAANANLGNLAVANYLTGTLTTAAQPNITSLGNLTVANVTGNILAGNVYANSGNIGANLLIGTLVTGSQPNITSVGTLSSLNVNGTVTAPNFTANTGVFTGNGNGLSSLVAANIVGTIANANYSTYAGEVINGTSTITIPTTNGNVNTSVAGNANILVVTGTGVNVSGTLNATGNANVGNIGATNANLSAMTVTGNANVGNLGFGSGVITGTGNITGGNIIGTIAAGSNTITTTGNITSGNANLGNLVTANFATTVLTTAAASQPNITSVGTLTTLGVNGTVTAVNITANTGVFTGNGSGLSAIAGGNVTGQVGNALIAGTVYTNAQPNITSVGTLTSLAVTGSVTAGNLYANTGNANIGNLTVNGTLTASSIAGISTLADGNSNVNVVANGNINLSATGTANVLVVTSTGANVTGYANVTGNINGANIIGNHIGNGSALSSITGANVTGAVAYATTANSVAGANVTGAVAYATTANSVAGANVSGAVAYATTANSVAGANVSGQVGNALVAGTVYTNAQPNITSVGTLTSLIVGNATANTTFGNGIFTATGNANVGNLGTAGLIVATGNVTGGNVTTAGQLVSSVATGTAPIVVTSTTTVANLNAQYAGTANSVAGANVTGAVAYATTANSVAGANVTGAVAYATTANSVAGANVSGAVGLATYATTANAVAGANVTGAVAFATTANSVAGANVSGQVGNALVAGTVYTNAQPNITSVGTLTSLSVTGNITAGNANVSGQLISTVATGTAPIVVTSTTTVANLSVATATTAGTVTTAAQPVITSVGTLTSLGVSGTVTASAFTANTGIFSGNGAGLTNLVGANVTGAVAYATTANSVAGANVSGQVGNALVAGTVYGAAQGNITSVGTLTSLAVTGNISGSNIIANAGGAHYGSGAGLTSIPGANVTGTLSVPTTSYAATVSSAAQPNITSVGTLSGLTVTGTISGNINGYAATVSSAAQPNITSVGTLSSLSVTANVSAGNFTTSGTVGGSAATLYGTTLTTGANTTAGTITGNWTLSAGSRWNATYADLAEIYTADDKYEPGTVLLFGGDAEVTIANESDSTRVAGVVSTNPAYVMNAGCKGEYTAEIALQGRVPTKVSGTVRKGDLMVSGPNGYAVANNMARAGTIIGKALENFDGDTGTIEIVVGRV